MVKRSLTKRTVPLVTLVAKKHPKRPKAPFFWCACGITPSKPSLWFVKERDMLKHHQRGGSFDGVFGGVFLRVVGDYLVGDLEEPPTMSVFWMVVLVFFTWALSEPKR